MTINNAIHSVPNTNVYYVAKNGSDTLGDGSILRPYLTIGAACTVIGNAANNTAFVDATQRYYVLKIMSGVYTETVTIPNRPYVLFDLNGSQINGNVTQNFDGTLLGGAITTAKVIFQGHDLIGLHTGLNEAVNDITGNITINRTGSAFNFNALEFINTGVSGNVIADGAFAYSLLLYTENSNIGGNVTANQTTININLYAENCNTPGTTGIGGTNGTGTVTLRNLRNVAFNGVVTTGTASAGFNWDNVSFAAVANTFAGLTSAITTDSASYQSYLTNVATKGSETFTFRDSAKGINSQYSPTNYTAANATINGNLSGIDTAIGLKAAKGANSDITSLSGLTTPLSGAQGGTGVINTGKTITLGGNLTTSGAFATTLTVTGATTITFPTTGTLVNSAVTTLSSLSSIGTITTGTYSAILQDYTETNTASSQSSTYAINLANSNVHSLTLTGNVTLSFSNVPASGCVSVTLMLIQDGTGSRTVTWPGSVIWPNGTAPTFTTTANHVDIVVMTTTNAGTTWRAAAVLNYSS